MGGAPSIFAAVFITSAANERASPSLSGSPMAVMRIPLGKSMVMERVLVSRPAYCVLPAVDTNVRIPGVRGSGVSPSDILSGYNTMPAKADSPSA